MANLFIDRTSMMPRRNLARAALGKLKGKARQLLLGRATSPRDPSCFALTDLNSVNEILARQELPPLTPELSLASQDLPGAMRYILASLALARPQERGIDPLALGSHFEDFLLAKVSGSVAAAENIRAAYRGLRGERMKRIQEMREDLRDVFPLGLTPDSIRADLLVWYLYHGRQSYEITAEEILWAFYEIDHTPDRGLVISYLLNPMWQKAVPHALTVFGWPTFKDYLSRAYNLHAEWFRKASLPEDFTRPWDQLTQYRRVRSEWSQTFPEKAAQEGDAASVLRWVKQERHTCRLTKSWLRALETDIRQGLPNMPGANLVGHFRYPSGLQEAVLGVRKALQTVGSRTTCRELPVLFECDWSERERFRGTEIFDHTIYLTAVNTFPEEWTSRGGIYWRDGVYRIAYWYWELEELPQDWLAKLQWMDEVWAPTSFLASTFAKYFDVPVVPMLPGVSLPAFEPRPRAFFGIPEKPFLFLVTFDMGSIMERKNPLAAIAAFRAAFAARNDVHLVVKVSRGGCNPEAFRELRQATTATNMTLINQVFSRQDALALLNAADCYVSLHRSEGLGLGMAESMLLGKPVIATAYSGNMDFMTTDTAYLVNYDRTTIQTKCDPYPVGCVWAEPRVEDAAAHMQAIVADPAAARARGERAKQYAQQLLDPRGFGHRMLKRLHEIRLTS